MEVKNALQVLNQALELANQKGAFTLKDASTVNIALSVVTDFVKRETANAEAVKESNTEKASVTKKVK